MHERLRLDNSRYLVIATGSTQLDAAVSRLSHGVEFSWV
jgi:hypothetical protein